MNGDIVLTGNQGENTTNFGSITQGVLQNQNIGNNEQLVTNLTNALTSALSRNQILENNQTALTNQIQQLGANQPQQPVPLESLPPAVQNYINQTRISEAFINSDIFRPLTSDPRALRSTIGKRGGLGGVSIDQVTIDAINTVATENPNNCTITQSHFLTAPATRFVETDTVLTDLSKETWIG